MDICFDKTPELFGIFHLSSLALILMISIFLLFVFRKKDEDELLSFIHVCGIVMVISEVWKQIFTHICVFNNIYNMWFFPWQLCSMAMYCGLFINIRNRKIQNALLVFLSSFSLLSALIALIGPLDMLRPQILLTCHGFIYHGMMVFMSLASIFILRKRNDHKFKDAVILYLGMAVIAEIINVTGHLVLHDIHREPDMFYITPYYPSTQPVFNTIALKFGIPAEIVFYLTVIALFSYLLYILLIKGIRS